MKKHSEKIEAWMIYVPAEMFGGPVDPAHHQIWDHFVEVTTGGLTIHKTVKGKWNDKETSITEAIIPVEVACTRWQLNKIINFTITHYEQKAVMAKKISDEVIIQYAK